MAQHKLIVLLGIRAVLAGCLVCGIAYGTVWAQGGATAQLHGIVRDPTGAVVAGAEIKTTQTDTAVVRTATTEADGGYVLTNLPLGPYRIEISKQGFTTYVQTGIVLAVGSSPAVDATLQLGTTTQEIVVQSSAPLVETRSVSIGQLVETQRILELPLNGRQPTDLIVLSGAAVANNAATGTTRTIGGPPIIQVAGGLSYSVGYLLDGANYYNYTSSSTNLMPFPDALQEFKVDTSGVSAQTASYAQVSAVTRSGSNALHGSLFEFIRNGSLNARNYFAPKRDDLKRNQFGGVIGGPIQKDKLFFFAGYQGTTSRSNNAVNQAFVPTPQMMAGNWTTYASAACNPSGSLTLGFPFVNNTISPTKYNPAALNLMNRLVATTPTPDPCGRLLYATPIHVNDHQFLGRLDYQLASKHSLFARYFAVRRTAPAASDLTSDLLASTATGEEDLMQSAVVGYTYVINSNVVNSIHLSTTRLQYQNLAGSYFSGCDLGINMYCGYYPTGFTVIMGSAFTIGQNLKNGAQVNTYNWNLNEDLTVIHGTHQFSFGFNPGLDYMNQMDCFFCAGVLVGSANNTGSYLSDFLTGFAAVFTQSAHWHNSIRVWHWNMYAADTWRATRRLSITYGLRWEPFLPETVTSGNIASFDIGRFRSGARSQVFPAAPPGFLYPGDSAFPNGLKGMNNHWAQFAPRVGLAWDVTGDGRTSVRASFGLSYDQIGAHIHDDQTQQPPFYNLTSTTVLSPLIPGGIGGLNHPWALKGGSSPLPGSVGTIPSFSKLTGVNDNIQQPYTSTWNLSIQRQLGENWMVSLGYIGGETTHMWVEQPLNYAICPPGTIPGAPGPTGCNITNTDQRRILNLQTPGLNAGGILYVTGAGTSSYNGMLLSAQHRLSRNFSVQSNWTWSHCISDFDPDPTMQAGEDDFMWTNPLDRRFDRGACDGDRRHVFNLTAVALAPRFSNHAWSPLARNWQLAPLFRLQSGQPLNVVVNGVPGKVTGPDVALNGAIDPIKGVVYQRANCVPGVNPYGSSGPGGQYLNPAAFSIPAAGTLGNCPYNGLQAPMFWQFDAALSRNFSIREGQHIEVRAEAFNLLNQFRPGFCNVLTAGCQFLASPYNGQVTFNSAFTLLNNTATFGKILNAMDPRIMQFAVKYVF